MSVEHDRISLFRFYIDVGTIIKKHKHMGAHVGELMFNHLIVERPELANAVKGTVSDPRGATRFDDPRFLNFFKYIEMNWYMDVTKIANAVDRLEQLALSKR